MWTNTYQVSDMCYDELDTEVTDPEIIAETVAKRLLQEITENQGGLNSSFQSIILILTALSKKGEKVCFDKITDSTL